MTKTTKNTIVFLSILLIAGCSPGTSEVNKALQKKYERIPEVKISSVTKTNGMDLGNGSYRVEFNYKVTFMADPKKLMVKIEKSMKNIYDNLDVFSDITRLRLLENYCGSNFREYGECHRKDVMVFHKTENGWME